MSYTVTVVVNDDDLSGYNDVYLVALWHLSQINPAPFGDPTACRFADKVGLEILRRFIARIVPELWNHQGAHEFVAGIVNGSMQEGGSK